MSAGKPARPFLIASCAAFLVLLLNILLRLMLHWSGTWVTLGIASAVGAGVLVWFLKWVKRPPTSQERLRFLWTYGALIVVPYLGLFLMGSARQGFKPIALVILALHTLAYLAAAQFFVAEKRFGAMLPRQP